MKRYIPLLLLFCLLLIPVVNASSTEYLVFTQVNNGEKTVFLYNPESSKTVEVSSGKKLEVFLKNKYFFYFKDRTLYKYDVVAHKSKVINKFKEDAISMGVITESEGLNQMLIVAQERYSTNSYILDLNDESIRRLEQLSNEIYDLEPGINSPDEKYFAEVKSSGFKERGHLSVQRKTGVRNRVIWDLPREMSIIPRSIVWSPNSKYLVFHAKQSLGYDGFYSLYYFSVDTKKLQLIEDSVLYYDLISSSSFYKFFPDWSANSQYLVFQTQPNGSPSQSQIKKFEMATGKCKVLTDSSGENQYPRFARSGKYIAFISSREQGKDQLYLVDGEGKDLKKVSSQGLTEWFGWYSSN